MTTETDRARDVLDDVRAWVESDALAALIATVAPDPPAESSPWLHLHEHLPEWVTDILAADTGDDADRLLADLVALERRAAGAFNFRGRDGSTYRERSQATRADFDDATRARILAHAASLGLAEATRPAHDRYDLTLVLGGGYRSPLLRARYAATIERAGVELGGLHLLGSPRFLQTDEKPVVFDYAPDATDEFDLLIAAAERELGLTAREAIFLCGCDSAASVCPRWHHGADPGAAEVPPEYTHERAAPLAPADGTTRGSVLSASTSRPPYRPDTADTLALWVAYADPTPAQRVLVVTSQLFVPFQRFDSLRRLFLPHGVAVDVVGFSADGGSRPLTAEDFLQETLSAIRSARRLVVEAVAILRRGS